ncbi:MAG: SDR family NAD(P)-dependent oxidoreductase [Planctomycetes bacterium]|nr:SDR family NAD(P)-dependent oxidoreductase [Planctomycetota bacterium]
MDGSLLVIGNSDGIGLAFSRLALARGLRVVGLSRSPAPLAHENLVQIRTDVTASDYRDLLTRVQAEQGPFRAAIYCAGIGNEDDLTWWRGEGRVIELNFLGAVRSLEVLLPIWLEQGAGHFVALSSLADALTVRDAPSYCSSKAGLSRFLEAAGLRLAKSGVAVSNVRFGFVDTKMARAPVRPFMIDTDEAARVLWRVLETRPLRLSHPKRALAMVTIIRWLTAPVVWFRRDRSRARRNAEKPPEGQDGSPRDETEG